MSEHRQLLLEWVEFQGRSSLKVTGWTQTELRELHKLDAGELNRRLALYPGDALGAGADRPALPAVAGSFALQHEVVRFIPRFPFVDGMSYSLRIESGGSARRTEIWAIRRPSIASASVATTQVLRIHPTASTLPYNLLRMYVHFSAPMSEGWAAQAISICDEATGESLSRRVPPARPGVVGSGAPETHLAAGPRAGSSAAWRPTASSATRWRKA